MVSLHFLSVVGDEILSMGGHERPPAYTKVSQCTKWRWVRGPVEMHREPDLPFLPPTRSLTVLKLTRGACLDFRFSLKSPFLGIVVVTPYFVVCTGMYHAMLRTTQYTTRCHILVPPAFAFIRCANGVQFAQVPQRPRPPSFHFRRSAQCT